MEEPPTGVLPEIDDPRPPYGRTGHPFFMHDMILSQPSAIERTVDAALRAAEGIPRPPLDRPLLFVGQGTSFHAALGGAFAARALLGPRLAVRAVASFDLLLDPETVEAAGVAVIYSASGETALTIRAQEALARARVPQVLVTATPDSASAQLAPHRLFTEDADERAWTHTVSFTTALAASYALLVTWTGKNPASLRDLSRAASTVVRDEGEWKALAEHLHGRRRILLVGSGPAEVTVREAALKLREGAGRFTATVGVEEFLHGTLPSIGDDVAVLAVAETALELARARHAVRAAAIAGAKVALFGPVDMSHRPEEYPLPPVPPAFSPAVHVIPLQLVTYWTAVREGRNPDVMGYDQPAIWSARRSFGI
ncbi:MAG: SIS domain-containing protein [Thermoplasmata archaeon]